MGDRQIEIKDSSKPFIKKFEDGGFFYVYDVNTNQIVEVEKLIYDIIDEYDDDNPGRIETKYKNIYDISDLRSCIGKIKDARKKHKLFSNFRPKKVTLGVRNSDDIKNLHEKGLKQILLQLTIECNHQCRYCRTSGKYASIEAQKSHMSKETCKKAVDFFCEKTHNSKRPFITFYGGEPLLRFDLLRETVAYVKKNHDRNKFSFNLTTNGTLLNKKIIDFFVKNDFYILVSLDGPENINDRYRVSRNGKGTFNTIIKNLEFLKKYNLDYYTRRVSISSVLAPPFDNIDEILDFYLTDKTLKEIRAKGKIKSNLVDTRGTTFVEDFGLGENMKGLESVNDKLLGRLKKSILSHNLNGLTIEKSTIYSILYHLSRRTVKRLYDNQPPLGVCHMGLRKLFVKTNGDFYICEKVENNYKIGCIDDGFDFKRIAGYYGQLEEVLEGCRNCWAISHCERCWVLISNLEDFSGKEKDEFCYKKKVIIEKAFKVYTELLRKDPGCLRVFKDVIIA